MGPPEELVLRLAHEFDVPYFVETGTLKRATAAWAAPHFRQVWTIEASKEYHARARERHQARQNIHFVLGDSRAELPRIVGELDGPAVFWLDAHWSGHTTFGVEDQCPVLDEIGIVNRSRHPSYVLIDDARLFLSPPQPPHRVEQWPAIATVVATLDRPVERYIVVTEDVIVAVPPTAKLLVVAHCQEVNARAWERHRSENQSSGLRRGLQLIGADLVGRLRGLVAPRSAL